MSDDHSSRLLTLSFEAADLIGKAVRDAHPNEACGLLFGEGFHVAEASAARNVAEDPSRFFEIDPQHLFDSLRHARASGTRILGCWHSHPGGAPAPSDADRAGIGDPDWIWLISGTGKMAAFGIAGRDFYPVMLAVEGKRF